MIYHKVLLLEYPRFVVLSQCLTKLCQKATVCFFFGRSIGSCKRITPSWGGFHVRVLTCVSLVSLMCT